MVLYRGARSLCVHAPFWSGRAGPRGCRAAADFAAAGAAISQRSFSVAAHSTAAQVSIPPPAASKTTDAARDPGSCQRRHREGADKEGTLAAMKALWRELADPKSRNIGPRREDHTAGRDREPKKAGCRLVSRRSDQGQAAPALAPVFNRVTPGFWGRRPPTYCVATTK